MPFFPELCVYSEASALSISGRFRDSSFAAQFYYLFFFRDSASRTFIYLFVLQKLAFLSSSRTAPRYVGPREHLSLCAFADCRGQSATPGIVWCARDVVAGLAPLGIFIRPLFRAGSPFYHISW